MTSLLDQVRLLAPRIAAAAGTVDAERSVPTPLVTALREAGCLRMLTPKRYGGADLTVPEALDVIEEVSAANGSVGWFVAQATLAHLVLRYFPEQACAEVYQAGPDVVVAGAVAPKGRAEAYDEHWRVTGDWPFLSGVSTADWVYLQCIVVQRGRPVVDDDGVPRLRLVLLPVGDVQVRDTWHTVGLRGTASHDVRVIRTDCPTSRTTSFDALPAGPDPVLDRVPARDQGGLFVAAVALGIARAALADVAALAHDGKRPAFGRVRLADDPVFQDRLGEAYLWREAAGALLAHQVATAWHPDREPAPLARAALRAGAHTVVTLAAQATSRAYELAGGSSVHTSHPLSARLRDIQAATQHVMAGRSFLRAVGATLAGGDPGILLR
ncbi:acyl-CoA dehydrogenase family protein [Micromonospora sp. FIMYZ51]|uniref:acyl-CoA dehydrogenase family protein n=1 Tax=Micromonospora sp. FIMYZ51 TaxID=3051832 RepID=UPI00311F96AB